MTLIMLRVWSLVCKCLRVCVCVQTCQSVRACLSLMCHIYCKRSSCLFILAPPLLSPVAGNVCDLRKLKLIWSSAATIRNMSEGERQGMPPSARDSVFFFSFFFFHFVSLLLSLPSGPSALSVTWGGKVTQSLASTWIRDHAEEK